MKIDDLNDDCGVRILSCVRIDDLFHKIRRVSRKFRDWAELVLDQPHWAAQLKLNFYRQCCLIDSAVPLQTGYLHVRSGAVDRFRSSSSLPDRSMSQLSLCNLLRRISSVSLREEFCGGQTATWTSSLRGLLGSLDNLKAMALVLCRADDNREMSDRLFSRLLTSAGSLTLRKLEKFDVGTQVESRGWLLVGEDDIQPFIQPESNVEDFARVLTCMRSLRDLSLPVGLFWPSRKFVARGIFAQLRRLELSNSTHSAKSCQDIVAAVCISCVNLSVFHYSCGGEHTPSGGQHSCLQDPSVLARLFHLNDLKLCFDCPLLSFYSSEPKEFVRGTFAVLSSGLTQFELYVHSSECLPCGTVCDWLKMAPSVKRLTYRCTIWPAEMPPAAFFDELELALSSGYFVRLESLNLDAGRGTNRKLFEQLSRITTLAVGSSLRSLKVMDHSDLALAESSAAFSNEEFSCITRALSEATNIESLTLNMKWSCENGSLLELERLLLAMRSGSVRQLTILMHWPDSHVFDDRETSPLLNLEDNLRLFLILMANRQAKRRKAATGNSLNEKVQSLPLLCVEAICKLTPTSKLIRIYSNTLPLPGAFWSFSVKSVLKKRLPLSLSEDLPYHQAADNPNIPALFDASGAKVATIIRPAAFRFSPLCEFVEVASVIVGPKPPAKYTDEGPQLYAIDGHAILSHLPNVSELTLSLRSVQTPEWKKSQYRRLDSSVDVKDLLYPNMKHLFSSLQSLTFNAPLADVPGSTVVAAYVAEFMRELTGLKRLDLPETVFSNVMAYTTMPKYGVGQAERAATRRVLSGLSSLGVWQGYSSAFLTGGVRPSMLDFVSGCCRQLTRLSVLVRGDFKPYLAAFRELPGLTSLGLNIIVNPGMAGVTFADRDRIYSVTKLQLACTLDCENARIFAIASLFPSVQTITFQKGAQGKTVLDLASKFCAAQVLPAVVQLSCFVFGPIAMCANEHLAQFLANSALPEAVDLSAIIFASLAQDSDSLAGIYRAMQSNSSKRLLMRGPLHRDALSKLQSHFDLNGESAKLSEWKDRDLGDQPGILDLVEISPQTEFEIVGLKSSVSLQGEPFKIRVIHEVAKLSRIFD